MLVIFASLDNGSAEKGVRRQAFRAEPEDQPVHFLVFPHRSSLIPHPSPHGGRSLDVQPYLLGDARQDRDKLFGYVQERSKPIVRDQFRIDEQFERIAGLFQLFQTIAYLADKFGIGPSPVRLSEIRSDRGSRTQ
jgi:hypothetical protein